MQVIILNKNKDHNNNKTYKNKNHPDANAVLQEENLQCLSCR